MSNSKLLTLLQIAYRLLTQLQQHIEKKGHSGNTGCLFSYANIHMTHLSWFAFYQDALLKKINQPPKVWGFYMVSGSFAIILHHDNKDLHAIDCFLFIDVIYQPPFN